MVSNFKIEKTWLNHHITLAYVFVCQYPMCVDIDVANTMIESEWVWVGQYPMCVDIDEANTTIRANGRERMGVGRSISDECGY